MMKKYNLSSIMKRAWELVKKAAITMSEALRQSWKEAKTAMKELKGTPNQIAWAEDIRSRAAEYVRDGKETWGKYPDLLSGFEFVENRLNQLFEIHDEATHYINNRDFFSVGNIKEKVNQVAHRYAIAHGMDEMHTLG